MCKTTHFRICVKLHTFCKTAHFVQYQSSFFHISIGNFTLDWIFLHNQRLWWLWQIWSVDIISLDGWPATISVLTCPSSKNINFHFMLCDSTGQGVQLIWRPDLPQRLYWPSSRGTYYQVLPSFSSKKTTRWHLLTHRYRRQQICLCNHCHCKSQK